MNSGINIPLLYCILYCISAEIVWYFKSASYILTSSPISFCLFSGILSSESVLWSVHFPIDIELLYKSYENHKSFNLKRCRTPLCLVLYTCILWSWSARRGGGFCRWIRLHIGQVGRVRWSALIQNDTGLTDPLRWPILYFAVRDRADWQRLLQGRVFRQSWRRGDQLSGIGMCRVRKHLFCWSSLDNLTGLHNQHSVGDGANDA